jgi:hypothetical protein
MGCPRSNPQSRLTGESPPKDPKSTPPTGGQRVTLVPMAERDRRRGRGMTVRVKDLIQPLMGGAIGG